MKKKRIGAIESRIHKKRHPRNIPPHSSLTYDPVCSPAHARPDEIGSGILVLDVVILFPVFFRRWGIAVLCDDAASFVGLIGVHAQHNSAHAG